MFKKIFFFALSGLLFVSCSSDEGDGTVMANISLSINNLESLGSDYVYEGWIIVNGSPVSSGIFTKVTFPQVFSVAKSDLDAATKFVLSIEPKGETGTDALTPSETKLLSGDFIGNANSVSISVENQFTGILSAQGKFILASPTDNLDNDEAGVWFMNPPNAGLTGLPSLGSGWKYEGWVVVGDNNNIVLSTGRFDSGTGSDSSSFFSGEENDAPNFPGEDFLVTGVQIPGLIFPLDLRNKKIIVSIEPQPDNSSEPFQLKPMIGTASSITGTSSVNTMTLNNASFPSGTVTR